MRIVEIIESRHWKNKTNGRTASLYGAVPWTGQDEAKDWEIESRGYTWRLDNGTIGLGRQPVKTLLEAEKVMKQFNERY